MKLSTNSVSGVAKEQHISSNHTCDCSIIGVATM